MADPELNELFAAWRAQPLSPSQPVSQQSGVDGSAAVAAALRQVAERRHRQRRWRGVGVAVAIAAGVFGVGVGAWFELAPRVAELAVSADPSVRVDERAGEVVVTDSEGQTIEASSALAAGYGLRTEQGSARLGFASGARARVSKQSSLQITRARDGEAFFLARGGVEVEVPKLDAKHGFFVQTPDVQVVVHGTLFNVTVESTEAGPRTHVGVMHGIVSVRHSGREVFLTAGQSWPPSEAAPPPSALDRAEPERGDDRDAGLAEDDAEPEPRVSKARKSYTRPRRAPARELTSRELADQNQRFARAMTLKKNGAANEALLELGKIARRYPASPLSQELRVERLRLLRSLGRTREGVTEARKYLRDYPQGYAVGEAEAMLTESRSGEGPSGAP